MHWILAHLRDGGFMLLGAILGSTAEKAFSYNLVDLLYDKLSGLFKKKA